jgi:hypothetical protein
MLAGCGSDRPAKSCNNCELCKIFLALKLRVFYLAKVIRKSAVAMQEAPK